MKPRRLRPLSDRFAAMVNVNGPIMPGMKTPCHLWTATIVKGYGQIDMGERTGKMVLAHRAAFFLKNGRWPTPCGLHRCDNRPCVNVEHIFEGTNADNTADMISKGRGKFDHLLGVGERLNLFGEAHPHAKVTVQIVREIRLAASAGARHRDQAKIYGITRLHVGAIVRCESWDHIL